MSNIVDKLRLKEAAEEDIYFAKRDLELIKVLHKKKLAKCEHGKKRWVKDLEKRFKALAEKNKRRPRRLARAVRGLLDEIREVCKQRRRL